MSYLRPRKPKPLKFAIGRVISAGDYWAVSLHIKDLKRFHTWLGRYIEWRKYLK